MTEPDNLWVGVGYVMDDGDMKAAFVVDARKYADDAAAREVIKVAGAVLRERSIDGQFEFWDVRSDQRVPTGLPSWDEYRDRMPDE
ncbi:hypothetical protein [Kribbella sp.]|uniref:hypothetical protein n=1 Tax=Kribbella sp. TaxID=1871183 RepID=UPI002D2A73E5|nr:hypothetical protein [Kribbella sp.]HZX09006.1 hypothetical protein [Kribbella sp.]